MDISKVNFSKNDFLRKIKIPSDLTVSLAEDIGIQVGDGSVYFDKEKINYRVECYGHAIEDLLYFQYFVKPLKENLFNLKLEIKQHKSGGTCYLRIDSKALLTFYSNVIGLPLGKKCQVSIPQIILSSSKDIVASCLRGICDTDFSLTTKKKNKNLYYYPVLHLGCNSKVLVRQIKTIILKKFGISTSANYDYKQYDSRTGKNYIKHDLFISGVKNLEKWVDQIGFNNPVHITKYLILDKFGFCPIKTTLKQRIDILEGAIDPYQF